MLHHQARSLVFATDEVNCIHRAGKLESLLENLVHLEKAVAVVLVFVGAKLMYHPFGETLHAKWSFLPHDISPNVSLMIVLGTLALGVIASFIFPEKEEAAV